MSTTNHTAATAPPHHLDAADRPPPEILAASIASESMTFAAEAGLTIRNSPGPLFRLLVLASLLAAPVQHTVATRASQALRPFTRSASTLAAADPADVDRVLTTAGYWRFHRTKADLLVRGAADVATRCRGDLRRLYQDAESAHHLHAALCAIPGIGTHAAHIVLREAQWVWPDLLPYLDARVLDGAARVGLPSEPDLLGGLVPPDRLPALAAGCVRTTFRGTDGG